jgi:type II secretory pathway pseudopilin PulG
MKVSTNSKTDLRKRPVAESGFTIVEIIVVIVLMLIVLYPLARVVASAIEATTNEQHLTHCAFLAQLKVEETRTRLSCYTNNTNSPPDTNCPFAPGSKNDFQRNYTQNMHGAPASGLCTFPYPFTQYKCTVDNGNTNINRLRFIQVRVWYDTNNDNVYDPDGNEPSVFLETLLTERPPLW